MSLNIKTPLHRLQHVLLLRVQRYNNFVIYEKFLLFLLLEINDYYFLLLILQQRDGLKAAVIAGDVGHGVIAC